MEQFTIEKEIHLICIAAASFPDGIRAAHEKLHAVVPFNPERDYYGVSWSEGGDGILYKAGAGELHDGEAEQLGCETFTVRKGAYIGKTLLNFPGDVSAIGKTFEILLADPRLDPDGYCLEVYLNERDVRCMVPVAAVNIR